MSSLRLFLLRLSGGGALLIGVLLGLFTWIELHWMAEYSHEQRVMLHLIRGGVTGVLLMTWTATEVLHFARRQRAALQRMVENRTADVERGKAFTESILSNTMDAILLWDAEGQIVFASASVKRMFGYPTDALVGRPLLTLLAAKHESAYARRVEEFQQTGRQHGLGRILRLEGRRRDGSTFPMDLLANTSKDDTGLIIGVLRDVSEQIQNEILRRRSESLRLMIDNLPASVMIHRHERLLYANRQLLDQLGYSEPSELIGRSLEELVHPDDLGRVRRRLDQIHSTGKPTNKADETFLCRNGKSVTLEVSKVPVVFDGKPAIVAIGRDTAERDLSEERFRKAVSSSPNGMVMIGSDGNIVLVNEAAENLFGYGEEELIGKPIETLVPERARAGHPKLRDCYFGVPKKRAMGNGRELYGRRKDGSEVPVEIGLNPIVTREGTFVLSSIVDISERKRNETVIAIADRLTAIGTLAAGVAHGINNPLAYVKGNLIFAREELSGLCSANSTPGGNAEAVRDPTEVLEALQQAEEGADRISDLVMDLLTFSRKQDSRVSVANLDAVLKSVLNMTRNEIRHRAELVRNCGDVPLVGGDPSTLAHAFTNLVINATQAIPDGHSASNQIRVTTRTDEHGWAVVEVGDTGEGITEDDQSRIFEPFYTTKPPGAGTGLGLSVTLGIVSSLGGSVSVESEPGNGTTFQVRLPPSKTRSEAIPQATDHKPTGHLRVLVVDDEPLVLKVIQRLLGREHEVVVRDRGQEALELIGRGPFDVILCDLLMPEMSGIEFYEEVLRRNSAQAERMIFVTGGAFTLHAQQFLETIENPIITKPVGRSVLENAIADVVRGTHRSE